MKNKDITELDAKLKRAALRSTRFEDLKTLAIGCGYDLGVFYNYSQESFKLYKEQGFSLKYVKTFEGCDRESDLKRYLKSV